MGKKKPFDDEYNQLFTVPVKKKFFGSRKQSNATPVNARKLKISWIIILSLGVIFLYFERFTLYELFHGNDKTIEVYPLKAANVKTSGTIDLSKPLVATLDNHTLAFNRGYHLNIQGDPEIELSSKELSVLPTKEKYVYDKTVANISFYKHHELIQTSEIAISGNLVNSLESYLDDNQKDFSKAFPQKTSTDGTKTGYIIEYSDDNNYISTTIQQYYIFSDGTGLTIKLDSDTEKQLSPKDNLNTIQTKYAADFKFLSKHFELVKQP